MLGAFIFLFKDTFPLERSLIYQAALRRRTNTEGNLRPATDSAVVEINTGTGEMQASEGGTPYVIKVESGLNDVRLALHFRRSGRLYNRGTVLRSCCRMVCNVNSLASPKC